jgi:hypothetical protein
MLYISFNIVIRVWYSSTHEIERLRADMIVPVCFARELIAKLHLKASAGACMLKMLIVILERVQ